MRKLTSILAIMLVCMLSVLALVACSASITGIELKSGTLESSITAGDTFDTSTAIMYVSYSDGTQVEVSASELTFSEIDTSTSGIVKLYISYGGFEVTHNITVNAKTASLGETATSLSLQEGTVASKVAVGDTLDTSSAIVQVTMDDGSTTTVDHSQLNFSSISTVVAGTQTLKITFTDNYNNTVTTTQSIEIVADSTGLDEVATLTIVSATNVVDYLGTLDTSKVELKATYGNGIITAVTSDITVNGLDTTVLGEQSVTFSYGGATTEATTVKVSADADQMAKYATAIQLVNTPAKTVSRLGTLSVESITASVTFLNSTSTTLEYEDLVVSGLDTDTIGDKTLTITYTDTYGNIVSTTHSYTVIALNSEIPDELTLSTAGTLATMVVEGGSLDVSDVDFTVEFVDGSTATASSVVVSGLDSSKLGEQTATITYTDEYGTASIQWDVTVVADDSSFGDVTSIDISGLANVAGYLGTYSTDNLVVVATYGNGTFATVTGATVTDLDTSVLGAQDITVSYSGATATYTVKVSADADQQAQYADDIALVTSLATSIDRNTALDTSAVQVTVTYLDTTTATFTVGDSGLVVSGDTGVQDTVGDYTITFTYTDTYGNVVSVDHNYTVNPLISEKADSLSVVDGTLATKVLEGGELSTTGASFVVTFEDHGTVTVTEGVSVAIVTSQLGTVTAVLSYTDMYGTVVTCDWAVEVVADDSAFDSVASIAISGLSNVADYLGTYSTDSLVVVATYGNGTFATVTGATVDTLDTSVLGAQDITVSYSGATATHTVTVSATSDQQKLYATSIVLTTSPNNTIDRTGTLDTSGAEVKVTYAAGNTATFTLSDSGLVVSGDTGVQDTVGNYTITFTYTDTYGNKVTVDHNYAVVAQSSETASSLSVVAGTLATNVAQNGTLDLTGAQFTVTFADGNTSDVANSSVVVTSLDTSTLGSATVTITFTNDYSTATLSWDVTIVADDSDFDTIVSIALVDGSIANQAQYDGTYSTADIEVLATYGDGTTTILVEDDLTISSLDLYTESVQSLTIEYGSLSIQYSVEVSANADQQAQIATSVELTTSPNNTIDRTGTLDTSGAEVKVTYAAGNTATFTLSDSGLVVSGDIGAQDTVGNYTITFTYTDTYGNKVTVDHNYAVVAQTSETASSLSVVAGTLATNVAQNGTLDTTDALFTVEFANGSTTAVTAVTVALDSTNLGEVTAVITYDNGYGTATLSWDVTIVDSATDLEAVASIATSGWSTAADYKSTYSYDGNSIVVRYTDGTYETITTGYTVAGLSTDTVGTNTITISYSGASTTHDITVSATADQQKAYASSLAITASPADIIYTGDSVDLASMIVTITFLSTDTSRLLGTDTTLAFSDVDTSVAGEHTLVVSYTDEFGNTVSANFGFTVLQRDSEIVSTIEVVAGTVATITTSTDSPDFSALNLMATYADGSKVIVYGSDISIVEITAVEETDTRIFQITYGGVSTTYSMDVDDALVIEVASIEIIAGTTSAIYLSSFEPKLTIAVTYTDGHVEYTSNNYTSLSSTTGYIWATGDDVTQSYNKSLYSDELGTFTATIAYFGTETEYGTYLYYISNGLPYTFEEETSTTYTYTVEATPEQQAGMIESIKLVEKIIPTKVALGGTLSTSGAQVLATFMDGSMAYLSTGLTFSTASTSIVGEQSMTVTYTDAYGFTASCTHSYTVVADFDPDAVESIELVEGTLATTVNSGTPDTTGVKLLVTKADGTTETVSTDIAFDTSTSGTVAITYGGVAINCSYTVDSSAVLTNVASLQVVAGTVGSAVNYGGTLDTSGIEVLVTYVSGLQETLYESDLTLSIDTTVTTDTTSLFITYGDETITHTVDVSLSASQQAQIAYSVAVSGIPTTVIEGGTLSTTNMVVTVTFMDGSTAVVPSSQYTVSSIDTSVVGDNTFDVVYTDVYGNEITVAVAYTVTTEAARVTVVSLTSDLLTEFSSNAGASSDSTSGFLSKDAAVLYAGDDSAFHFRAVAYALDGNDNKVQYDISAIATTVTIAWAGGAELTSTETDKYFDSIDYTAVSFNFSSEAIGQTFKISVSADNTMGSSTTSFSSEVTVTDGYNIYEAYELSLYDNRNAFREEDGPWDAFKTYYFGENWEELYPTDSSEENYIDNFVLQADINVTMDDIAKSLLWSDGTLVDELGNTIAKTNNYDQACKVTDQTVLGTLRDEAANGIYNRDFYSNESTELEGNYFTIDASAIGLMVVEDGETNGTYGADTETTSDDQAITAHTSLFYHRYWRNGYSLVYYPYDSEGNYYSSGYTGTDRVAYDGTTVYWQNVALTGNTPNDGSVHNSGGITGLKNNTVNFLGKNIVANYYYMAFLFNRETGDYLPFSARDNSEVYTMTSCKINSSYHTAICVQGIKELLLVDCEIIGCGGPAILADSLFFDYDEDYEGNTTYELDGTEDRLFASTIHVVNSTIETTLSGNESWFTTYGASTLVTTVAAGNSTFSGDASSYGSDDYSFLEYISGTGYMNMKCVFKSNKTLDVNTDNAGNNYGGTYVEFEEMDQYTAYKNAVADGTQSSGYYTEDGYSYYGVNLYGTASVAGSGVTATYEATATGGYFTSSGLSSLTTGTYFWGEGDLNIYIPTYGFVIVLELFPINQ